MGNTPSLARIFDTQGSHKSAMFPLERVSPARAGEGERYWARVLSPTVNQVLPFRGIDRVLWEEMIANKTEAPRTTTLRAKVLWMMQSGNQSESVSQLLHFFCDV